jgi:hypothetical protein
MQNSQRLHPATVALVVACPLFSAVTIGGIAVGLAAAVGSQHVVVIGAAIAATVFVVNAAALCMAVSRREQDERAFAFEAVETVGTDVGAPAHARAS